MPISQRKGKRNSIEDAKKSARQAYQSRINTQTKKLIQTNDSPYSDTDSYDYTDIDRIACIGEPSTPTLPKRFNRDTKYMTVEDDQSDEIYKQSIQARYEHASCEESCKRSSEDISPISPLQSRAHVTHQLPSGRSYGKVKVTWGTVMCSLLSGFCVGLLWNEYGMSAYDKVIEKTQRSVRVIFLFLVSTVVILLTIYAVVKFVQHRSAKIRRRTEMVNDLAQIAKRLLKGRQQHKKGPYPSDYLMEAVSEFIPKEYAPELMIGNVVNRSAMRKIWDLVDKEICSDCRVKAVKFEYEGRQCRCLVIEGSIQSDNEVFVETGTHSSVPAEAVGQINML
mmetsp:Transcript_1841/g.2921  ORF Transcript_1841/g.2921 Transcript_1841/m.2921 type:complete len:337 (+) Transcript_1841:63-1073(+)